MLYSFSIFVKEKRANKTSNFKYSFDSLWRKLLIFIKQNGEIIMIEKICRPVKTLDGKFLHGWAQSTTKNRVPYYINHNHVLTQWDHPECIRLMDEILRIDTVKYAAYRTACKLRHLQTKLKFCKVLLKNVTSTFDQFGFRATENRDVISVTDVENILLRILQMTYKNTSVDVTALAEVTLNLILNAYDEKRAGNVRVLQCKTFLIVLCSGRMLEKYRYLFSQIADRNNYCTKKRLGRLLSILSKIPELLSEQLSFGISYVTAAVESCFKETSGEAGISEDHFLNWLLLEPQMLVWWTTLYRLSTAELVCHDVKCSVCKQHPCIGLRYQCLRCLSYNMCQDCFLHDRTSKNHKSLHPMQEYCHESSLKDWSRSWVKILRHRLKRSISDRPRYLSFSHHPVALSLGSLLQDTYDHPGSCDLPDRGAPPPPTSARTENELMAHTLCQSIDYLDKVDNGSQENKGNSEVGEPVNVPSSSNCLIQSVIIQLQEEYSYLREQLEKGGADSLPSVLRQHILELQTQINKLQNLLQDTSTELMKKQKLLKSYLPRMVSTPVVGERGLHLSLSPIGLQTESHNDSAVLDNKENHKAENTNCNVISSTRRSITDCEVVSDRQALPTITESEIISPCQDVSVRPKEVQRFPSFTEVTLRDLTCAISVASSGDAISNNNIYKECQDELRRLKEIEKDSSAIASCKEELDKLLTVLDEAFPVLTNGNIERIPSEVITVANEVGDIIVHYIESIPVAGFMTSL